MAYINKAALIIQSGWKTWLFGRRPTLMHLSEFTPVKPADRGPGRNLPPQTAFPYSI